MKILSYIIAIVVLIASAWFSYDVKTKFTGKRADFVKIDGSNETREGVIEKTKKKAASAESDRDAAQVALSETEGSLRTKQDNLALSLREQATWNDKVAGQNDQIQETEALIQEVKGAFANLDADIEEIPGLLKELEEDVKSANVKVEEVTELASSADARVDSVTGELAGLRQRVSDRAARIKSNSLEGFITAINHDWGIAVVNVPANMPIESSTKLMVRRGTSYVGKLKISSIEGSKVITDIDYKSMNKGIVLQPGDTVFLAKPVTN